MTFCGDAQPSIPEWPKHFLFANSLCIDDVIESFIIFGYFLKYNEKKHSQPFFFSFVMELLTKWVLKTSLSRNFCEDHIVLILPIACYHSLSLVPDLEVLKKLFEILVNCAGLSSLFHGSINLINEENQQNTFFEIVFSLIEKIILNHSQLDMSLSNAFLYCLFDVGKTSSSGRCVAPKFFNFFLISSVVSCSIDRFDLNNEEVL